MTIRQYTPNLQDDSDANYNDQAGSRIKLEKGCEKVIYFILETCTLYLFELHVI